MGSVQLPLQLSGIKDHETMHTLALEGVEHGKVYIGLKFVPHSS